MKATLILGISIFAKLTLANWNNWFSNMLWNQPIVQISVELIFKFKQSQKYLLQVSLIQTACQFWSIVVVFVWKILDMICKTFWKQYFWHKPKIMSQTVNVAKLNTVLIVCFWTIHISNTATVALLIWR